ncbi:hypothetical protein NDU88_007071 [Pleurodeles waltl]|uniref:Uncharacterized protein n=1 Tax=Pleurodeles waltl TaxID=8319 RepID=A0AAV7VNN4_PLEWA|nr:hypothetical protein NDU88_007071 [Pleurodeles waltl]
MPVPPHAPLRQASSFFRPVSRLRSNAQSHSAGSATRQQVTPAVQANHQHLAPRGTVQRRSSTLLLPPGVRKWQAPAPSQKCLAHRRAGPAPSGRQLAAGAPAHQA